MNGTGLLLAGHTLARRVVGDVTGIVCHDCGTVWFDAPPPLGIPEDAVPVCPPSTGTASPRPSRGDRQQAPAG